MPKFRKKPVVIDAVKWDGTEPTFLNVVLPFLADGRKDFKHLPNPDGYVDNGIGVSQAQVHIPTLEGTMLASPGDWIIKGVNGEFYPCKPDIFEKTYEPVEEPPNA